MNFWYAQVVPSMPKEEKNKLKKEEKISKYNKISLLDTIEFKPKYSLPIDKSSRPFGKMYRDNFTGRMYFQNGFDRTVIYSRN
ncbi:hypothetical protein ATB97_18810 [Elizabethkingia bruuniana]|nr:hypothetical protein AYC65_14215 [Elizabethkingia bruuniana]KGO10994.1 hypothetical protein KS04_06200 [Elizabethkingia miricola]KUY27740.1 hypothetical protein ATB97_18810 [Elizabethkingia bruuniana]OPB63538.1 hypothetical protein BAY12_09035 [Elizabethkingia bruuniana]